MAKLQYFTTMLGMMLIAQLSPLLASASDPTTLQTNDNNIESLLQDYIEINGGVGAAVCVIDQGEIQLYTYGNQSLQNGNSITKDTVFELGAITKVFTTLALVDMVSKGEVQLNDPIEMYLPNVNVPELNGNKITLLQLATHSSGLPRMPDNFKPSNPANPFEGYSTKDLYDFLNGYTLKNSPGSSFEYSNLGMALLGHILCLKSGMSYDDLIRNLTQPIGMQSTSVALTPQMANHFATGYQWHQETHPWTFDLFESMGGLHSTAQDMSLFLATCMGLNSSRTTELLQYCEQSQYTITPTFGIGLGWITSKIESGEIIWHNGVTGGFRSFIGFNPSTQKGVIILTNGTENWPDEFAFHLLDPSYKPLPIDRDLANSPEYLSRFLGGYQVTSPHPESQQQFQIYSYGKLLVLVLPQNEVVFLYPKSFGVFGLKGYEETTVSFIFNPEKGVAKIEATGADGTLLWEAVPLTK